MSCYYNKQLLSALVLVLYEKDANKRCQVSLVVKYMKLCIKLDDWFYYPPPRMQNLEKIAIATYEILYVPTWFYTKFNHTNFKSFSDSTVFSNIFMLSKIITTTILARSTVKYDIQKAL